MKRTDHDRRAEAIAWMIRLREGVGPETEEFVSWLEESAGNRTAFDQLAWADADAFGALEDQRSVPPAREFVTMPATRSRWWLGPAVGAAIAAAFSAVLLFPRGAAPQLISTGPGEQRTIALADGSRIELNGDTRLLVGNRQSRDVSLQSGQAYFAVVHDPTRPFRVRVGKATIEDVGTAFAITRDANRLEVSVEEGRVEFQSGPNSVTLGAGEAINSSATGMRATKIDRSDVAGWRKGIFSYSGRPIGEVVEDVERARGYRLDVDSQAKSRPFSGTIVLPQDPTAAVRKLGLLLGLDVIQRGERWQLRSKTSVAK
ncbi:MAG: FecR domain-containing protein [Sphingomicrobium sp.]